MGPRSRAEIVRCPGARRRRAIRPVQSWKWLTLVLVALAPMAPGVLPIRAAGAQGGGTLVVGLDQDPPTLAPHASPSAATSQAIASGAQDLLPRGPPPHPVPLPAPPR